MFSLEARLPSEILKEGGNVTVGVDSKSNSSALKTSLESWKQLREEVEHNPNDISRWNKLFSSIEEKVSQLYERGINEEFKAFVYENYNELLGRFPYLVKYWKDLLIMAYRLNGVESSIEALLKAVDACPFSIDLWHDYLSALLVRYEQKDDKSGMQDMIQSQFSLALSFNKFHFNSHPIWDKYIEFLHLTNPEFSTDKKVLNMYLELSNMPLYEYAKYYNQFTAINKNFQLQDVIQDSRELDSYLHKFGKNSVEECSVVESQLIIDDFSYNVFLKTQTLVHDKWQFESSITINELDLTNYQSIQKEMNYWKEYLNFEIKRYLDDKNMFSFNNIVNLFERCLIPNCFVQEIWLKYIAFLNVAYDDNNENNIDKETTFHRINLIYLKANNKFIPLDENYCRLIYGEFLVKWDKFELANDYYLDLITSFCGHNDQKVYLKQSYLDNFNNILQLWKSTLPNKKLVEYLYDIIEKYFESIDRYKSKQQSEHEEEQTDNKKHISLLQLQTFQELLNDHSICLVIKVYLYSSLEMTDITDEAQLKPFRDFFQKYYKEKPLQFSVSFWKFFIEFEGLMTFNYLNLQKIINYVKTNLLLPKTTIDALLQINYDIINANYKEVIELIPDDTTLINFDNETCNSITQNKSLLTRLAKNNSIMQHKLKGNKNPNFRIEDEYVKLIKKQSDLPGVIAEDKPEITNKLMNDENYVSLLQDNIEVPRLPAFKNVEKANAPIPYPN